MAPLLRVEGLHKEFHAAGRSIYAVGGVSFAIQPGEAVALVGESGCGKSTTARCILGLTAATAGAIHFLDRRVSGLSERQFRPLRQHLQMVFQDPAMALNPRMRVRSLLDEPLVQFRLAGGAELNRRVEQTIQLVGLGPEFLDRYPRELSGGQRQRVGIARAIITRPRCLVLDEPTSALDMSLKRQIVDLLRHLQAELGMAYLLISHDLSTVRHLCSRTLVMYLGRIVEEGSVGQVFATPAHPYTRSLLSAIPVPDPERKRERIRLRGETPSLTAPHQGCPLADRCPEAMVHCRKVAPEPHGVAEGHWAACHLLSPDPALCRGTPLHQ